MLNTHHSLHFPKLKYTGKTSFKSWGNSKETSIYIIEWPEESFLPSPYCEWLDRFSFIIPSHYKEEITRLSYIASYEWGRPANFDTAIRPFRGAVGFVYDAFRLISDCIYDKNTDYFYRGKDKPLIFKAMLYKFWSYNTGFGMIREHADIQEHKNQAKLFANKSYANMAADFISVLNKFESAAIDEMKEFAIVENMEEYEKPTLTSEFFVDVYNIQPIAPTKNNIAKRLEKSLCSKVPNGWTPMDGLPRICAVGDNPCCQSDCGCPTISD
jgi:hypothetical protein